MTDAHVRSVWTRLWGGVMLPQAHSHYDSHAADTNAPNNMLTHIKSGYGFLNVYMRYTNTFLIHIRFCSLCILLRRKVLACSTYLLASMTDHPCRDLLFMYMRCVLHNHPYWLCLSPHPKPFGHRCGQSTVLAKYRNWYYNRFKEQLINIVDHDVKQFLNDT